MSEDLKATHTQADLKRMADAPKGKVYLAMVPHGWAKRTNAFEAFAKARGFGVSATGKDLWSYVYLAPEDAWVDEMGVIRWADGDVGLEEVAVLKYRRAR